MPREHQRQQLVTHLAIAHRAAVVVTRAQHQAEDVVAATAARPPPRDRRVRQRVQAVADADHPRVRPDAAERPAQRREQHQQRAHRRQRAQKGGAQFVQARRLVDAEDRAQDDVDRDGRPGVLHREGRAGRPRRGLSQGRLAHDRAVGPHPLAVKRRRQQLAIARVARAARQQQRRLSQQRRYGFGRPAAEALGRQREDRPHALGCAAHDDRAQHGRNGEHVAEAARAVRVEPQRIARIAQHLHDAPAGPGRQTVLCDRRRDAHGVPLVTSNRSS